MKLIWIGLAFFLAIGSSRAQEGGEESATRRVHVIVALCDNEHQGIVPVNARIGNGDDLEHNLYWGCSDGLWRYFRSSPEWTLVESKKAEPKEGSEDPWEGVRVLETQTWSHQESGVLLIAEAWRGREIEKATKRFLDLLADNSDNSPDLVAWIGHNGLMDFRISYNPNLKARGSRDAVVLCCKSRVYFSGILEDRNVRPLLMTEQFMYPGSFLLKAALDGWLKGESRDQIRDRAARAYVKNQKISFKAARGVFSNLE